MLTRPPDLSDLAVIDALVVGWDLVTDEIEYAPVGFGSHHWRVTANSERWFVTIDDLDARQRLATDTRADAAALLTAALGTALSLRDGGLTFVVAPRPTLAGDVLHRINDRYVSAVYEHVAGVTHDWGAYSSRSDRLAVLDRLVTLHQATEKTRGVALIDDFAIPGREQLLVALCEQDRTWGPGPSADKARQLLQQHSNDLTEALARYDRLVAEVAQSPERFVITHGEPHRANTINTTEGVVLIDWDTTLLAPPERDLWMLLDDDLSIAASYSTRTGVEVDPSAVKLYRLWWDLCEVSLYSTECLAAMPTPKTSRRHGTNLATTSTPNDGGARTKQRNTAGYDVHMKDRLGSSSDGVYLRRVESADLMWLAEIACDPALTGEHNWAGEQRDPKDVEAKLQEQFTSNGLAGNDSGTLIVCLPDGTRIGDVAYRTEHWGPSSRSRCPAFGINLLPIHRGQGYGTSAQRLLVDYLFTQDPDLHRVQSDTAIDHPAERRALAKIGMVEEGIVRSAEFRNGVFHDHVLLSVLRAEWERQQA